MSDQAEENYDVHEEQDFLDTADDDLQLEREEADKEILRADVEEVIRNAYNTAWMESKRWPNRKQPPRLEITWDVPDGIRITADFNG